MNFDYIFLFSSFIIILFTTSHLLSHQEREMNPPVTSQVFLSS
jgi:hypothetical protein